jgi:hypothetical protein
MALKNLILLAFLLYLSQHQTWTATFQAMLENSRLYQYALLVLFPIGADYPVAADTNRLEYAEQVVATVIDEIVNTMDTDFELPSSDVTVLYMEAADCTWGTYSYEGGVAKAAQINLKVYTETNRSVKA